MFFSKAEKEEMRVSIRGIQAEIRDLKIEVSNLTKLISLKNAPPSEKRKGHQWNEASKKTASERMKKYWADRKAKKETP